MWDVDKPSLLRPIRKLHLRSQLSIQSEKADVLEYFKWTFGSLPCNRQIQNSQFALCPYREALTYDLYFTWIKSWVTKDPFSLLIKIFMYFMYKVEGVMGFRSGGGELPTAILDLPFDCECSWRRFSFSADATQRTDWRAWWNIDINHLNSLDCNICTKSAFETPLHTVTWKNRKIKGRQINVDKTQPHIHLS